MNIKCKNRAACSNSGAGVQKHINQSRPHAGTVRSRLPAEELLIVTVENVAAAHFLFMSSLTALSQPNGLQQVV